MSQILAPGSGITIEAGGQVLAHAAGYSVKMSRACVAVWPYGSTEPLTLLPGSTSHILQLEQIRTKWERHVPRASVFYASPYGDPAALDRVCARLREAEGSLVVLDCIGYTQAMKRRIAAATGKNVILARTLLARVVDELLDT